VWENLLIGTKLEEIQVQMRRESLNGLHAMTVIDIIINGFD